MQHMEVLPEEEVPVEPSKSLYLPHHDAVMKVVNNDEIELFSMDQR